MVPFHFSYHWNGKQWPNCLLDSLGFQKNGVAVIVVYQKPTLTDWYLDFSFHHGNKIQYSLDPSVLASILCSTNEEKKHEFKQITCTDTLKASGYPSAVISNSSKKKPPSLVVPSPPGIHVFQMDWTIRNIPEFCMPSKHPQSNCASCEITP